MKLKITSLTKTWTIKRAFNRAFPFLKIEFFTSKHAPGEPTAAKKMIKENLQLAALNPGIKDETVLVQKSETVARIERNFQDLGLPIQIFRKQKNVWIETTATDQLTLEEQNEKGRLDSLPEIPTSQADRYLEDGQYS